MVLAGAAVVPRGSGLGRPGGPGWTGIRQSQRFVGGVTDCHLVPHHPSDLREVSDVFTFPLWTAWSVYRHNTAHTVSTDMSVVKSCMRTTPPSSPPPVFLSFHPSLPQSAAQTSSDRIEPLNPSVLAV